MIKFFNPFSSSSLFLLSSSFLLFFFHLPFILSGNITMITWEIFTIYNSTLYFPLILDPLGLSFSAIVLFIAGNVMKFATSYMKEEKFSSRFSHLILLFVFSMNMLIFFPHLMTLLLGWDGLGLVSFILVIYYQNAKSLGAGMITALTNRIGDATLLLAIGWTLNSNQWSIINMWNNPLSNITILCILIAAMTKSAQMPFSSWLPAAMAAPTPVSALVHSSTLVTAGVFLLIRFYPFLQTMKYFHTLLLFLASLTMFMAGLSALTECDLKKIIALSTLSQLGVMMASLGMGFPMLAFFHLITHALFKALLFICAGSIIHFHHHGQDLRTVGNLAPQLPLTMSAFLIANMSLSGLPFLSGFYSKDFILETALFNPTNWVIFLLFFSATMLTMMYSIRFLLSSIWSPNSNIPIHTLNNIDTNIWFPAMLLTLGAVFMGSILNWMITPITQDSILPSNLKTLPLLVTILGLYMTTSLTPTLNQAPSSLLYIANMHEASCSMWYLSPLSTQNILPAPLYTAHSLQKTLDSGWSEMISAQGIFKLMTTSGAGLLSFQKNHIIIIMNLMSISFILLMINTLMM